MDDSMMDDSVFSDGGSSDFAPVTKKAKAPAKTAKTTKTAAKPAAKPKAAAGKAKATGLKQTTLKATKAAPKKRAKPVSEDENSDIDHASINDDSLLSNTPPSAKNLKKAPAPKKSSGKPLQSIENESFTTGDGEPPKKKPTPKKGGNSDRYQKLTQLEHIVKRPDTYIGSVEPEKRQMWVFNSTTESMEMREVTYVPGLYKIFDEILVNAADNKQNDKNMDEIRVTVDRESGVISVWNNGRGIPIEIHAREGIYIPEMIFGHLLTSSNYDDDQQKVTGGRNGYGAKLCNVFSTEFTIETADAKQKKRYKQTWTKNMSVMGKAKITDNKNGDEYTKATFCPDYAKFGMAGIDDDLEALIKRRVYDLAGTSKGVKVKLNGDRIKVNTFQKYIEMYTKAIKAEQGESETNEKQVILRDNPDPRWEIGFAVSDGSFQQVSFVNSIATSSGGSHVNYVADQIVSKLMDILKKDKKSVQLKPHQIKNHLFLFVNCQIVNPAFTSQTKEQLTTKPSQFGSRCVVSDEFLKKMLKTDVLRNIRDFAQKKADQMLSKSDGSKRSRMNNSKLTDANRAGTKDGWRCTLILTEGDSASGLALAGRSVVGADYIGVFPLRGKLLNVRDASIDQITKNQEIQNIKKFMGLQHKKEYTDTKSLRYGHLMIMTDQDHDGSHIKGLLINFIQCSFPSLLKIPDFLNVFITPIVKVWKGDPKHPKSMKSFFTMPEYNAWKLEHGHQKGWDHKYFKGLGTSDPEDGEIYFRDLDRHLKEFEPIKREETELIDLAFSKKKADARKNWLREFVPGTFLDMSQRMISYDEFVNKELILFSIADCERSIPSMVDGLKPTQRKVMYTCFRRNLKKDVKVVELAGSVSEMTKYAYGESSMQQTIVGLAQNFVGSNNVNLLEPSGTFGTRRMGGQDAASPRYIYTRLSPFARKLFNPADEPLLKYHEDDGKTIEPHSYVPVLPMILVNGADGIGTGWSTSIPNYKPEDIVDNMKRRMAGTCKEDMLPMTPWFRGFKGPVEDLGGNKFKFGGIIRKTGNNEVEITELPVRMWTQDFKDKLEEIISAEKTPSFVKDYSEYNTPTTVHFIIKMEDKHMQVAVEMGLDERFKLAKTMTTTNLVAFDAQGRIHKYDTVLDIMEEFYHVRLRFYEKRKEFQLDQLQKELDKLSNQSRFIQMVIDNKLTIAKKKKQALVAELQKLNFRPFPKVADAKKEGELEEAAEDEEESEAVGANDYDYLLGMPMWSLTRERIDKLLKQIGDKETEIDLLIKLSPKDLWTRDLDDFVDEWHAQLADEQQRKKKIAGMGRRASAKLGGIAGSKASKRKAADSDDGDFEIVKKKKTTLSKAPVKNAGLLSYLNKAGPTKAVLDSPPATEVGAASPPRPKFQYPSAGFDGSSDVEMADSEPVKPAPVTKTTKSAKPAAAKPKKPAASKAPLPSPDSDDDADVFVAVAEEPKRPARQARTAARKPAKYVLSSDSDSDASDSRPDHLGDVSMMVKGIGLGPDTSSGASRTLFSNTARPGSANGLSAKAGGRSRLSTMSRVVDLSDDEIDATDYTKLIPQDSPRRPAVRTANETVLSDDEEEEDSFIASAKPKPKAVVGKVAAAKPTAKRAVEKAPKTVKPVTLSPAAKAYAMKQAKASAAASAGVSTAKPKAKAAPKVVDSEDDMVDELLSDEEEEESLVKPVARPGRLAARKPAKYVVSEEESEEDSFQEESFVVDDDSD
ncbi:type II DNA topoisomerase [Eremomyces bilateralis CBS 781.70]|uniref:DNA topoisomerase 2 n=1 Tax=Eremomyces bilateralis CBS 781.70 TaxID=1392243 RepID=A0A6G1G7G9_9PEZI|nr:type II DNA topoisomerase [Eremomyces bilateralis CBS 781.70]KAF1813789.1 type II DNA topoisomerase [Eremomyces bilateralis CBS 781.70]